MIKWQTLDHQDQLEVIDDLSRHQIVLIFKHSTRCSISSIAMHRLEEDWVIEQSDIIPFYLDLISYRSISDQISEHYHIYHESPQVLLIKNGACILDLSHLDISFSHITAHINQNKEIQL